MRHGCVQEIVAEWRKEMAREAADFSQADALDLMAIEPATVEGAGPEDMMDILKRAYRRQALKLHPDKNPEGPEPFLKMQRAYQALMAMAQGEAEVGGGPRPARISLLLRAQCLLHRREPDVLGEYTYPAYDTLLSLLHETMAEGLEHEHVQLCLELTWLTLNACPDNAPFLGDKGAVPVLAALLQRCREAIPEDAPASADRVVLATLTLRALALVLLSEDARGAAEALPQADRAAFLRNLLWAAALPRATNASAAAVATVAAAVQSSRLRGELLQMAVLSTLFSRMLLCAPTPLLAPPGISWPLRHTPRSRATAPRPVTLAYLQSAAGGNYISHTVWQCAAFWSGRTETPHDIPWSNPTCRLRQSQRTPPPPAGHCCSCMHDSGRERAGST